MVETAIVNVVATAALGQKIDLYELARFREIVYDPEIYRGRVAYFKSLNMKGKVSIFPSGKMISVGTKSEAEAARELELTRNFLVENGFVKPSGLKQRTVNIIVTADFGENVNLEELSRNYRMIYEPEQFPAAILKIAEPYKASILVFASGKTVVAGLSSSIQIKPLLETGFEFVCEKDQLLYFRKRK